MMQKLFHRDIFIPDGIKEECKELQRNLTSYFYSTHFQQHLDNQPEEDRSHLYLKDVIAKCLNSVKTQPRQVFEVELTESEGHWRVTKYCCRIPYDSTSDLVVAIRPQYKGDVVRSNMIVTAWMNSHGDSHYTLDEAKYCSRPEWDAITRYKT